MATVYNAPTWSFVVVVSDDNGRWIESYQVDQFVRNEDGQRGRDRVRNQVERHLYHQFRRTGNHHQVVYEGNPEMAAAILADSQHVKR